MTGAPTWDNTGTALWKCEDPTQHAGLFDHLVAVLGQQEIPLHWEDVGPQGMQGDNLGWLFLSISGSHLLWDRPRATPLQVEIYTVPGLLMGIWVQDRAMVRESMVSAGTHMPLNIMIQRWQVGDVNTPMGLRGYRKVGGRGDIWEKMKTVGLGQC